MKNSYNKVRLRDMDPEVLLALHGGSISDIQKLLGNYFNKQTDKISKNNIDQSFIDYLKKYSDDEDQKIKNSFANYRPYNNPIKESDLDSSLINKINNCIDIVNTLSKGSSVIDSSGNKVDLKSLNTQLEALKRQVETMQESITDINQIRNEFEEYKKEHDTSSQDSKYKQLKNDIDALNTLIAKNYRDKITPIEMKDLSGTLQNKINSIDSIQSSLQQQINNLNNQTYPQSVNIEIEANSSWFFETSEPERFDLKILIYDDEADSRTHGAYINSEGILTVVYYTEDNTAKDETGFAIYNDSDQKVKAKIIYTSSTTTIPTNISQS